jgi:hypothetical protein
VPFERYNLSLFAGDCYPRAPEQFGFRDPMHPILSLQIDRSLSVPLVSQVVEAIKARIDLLDLRPEERMPSIRQLASSAGVSRNTVIEAYEQLVALGLLR